MKKEVNGSFFEVPDGYTADMVTLYWNKSVKDFEILLIKRGGTTPEGVPNVFPGKFAIPGGFVDYDKDNGDASLAAKREMKEEAGVDLNNVFIRHMGVYDSKGRDPRGWIISNVFVCILKDKSEPNYGDDAIDAKWIRLSKIKNKDMAFDHYQIISDTLEKIKKDIYFQVLDDDAYNGVMVSEILGDKFTVTQLHNLALYSGNEKSIMTFSRNIDKYFEKVDSDKKSVYYRAKNKK